MELLLFRTFAVVAETGSFTAAAERLCVTQSAVSRRIRQLEDQYGVRLLERGVDSVSPTTAGAMVLQKARKILAVENEMEEEVAELAGKKRLGFCCTPCFGTGILPRVFERFVATDGMVCDFNINFLMPEEIAVGIRNGTYDFAVVEHCDDLDPNGVPHHALPPDTMLFASAPSLHLDQSTVTMEDLARYPLFLKAPHGCAYRFIQSGLRSLGHSMDVLPNLAFYDDLPGLIQQVVAGMGIGFLSRTLIGAELEAGKLRIHRMEGLNQFRQRTLLLAPGRETKPLIRDFIAAIFVELGAVVPVEFSSSPNGKPAAGSQ
ncbi:LysR family transcriptional regulator [bacterium CG17_big_fil_post_rev_8_21_14_2_50_64_8]|nr:MAG: LysR family transcriptional regulator [bacterium CG17_big_fil_post_rev_8_21_14_2_50_64_8]PJA76685.1 MAG: LysR family transcriptional regulator [bacterium CG_4_9_14_3_um_filter_65_15]